MTFSNRDRMRRVKTDWQYERDSNHHTAIPWKGRRNITSSSYLKSGLISFSVTIIKFSVKISLMEQQCISVKSSRTLHHYGEVIHSKETETDEWIHAVAQLPVFIYTVQNPRQRMRPIIMARSFYYVNCISKIISHRHVQRCISQLNLFCQVGLNSCLHRQREFISTGIVYFAQNLLM